MIHPRVQLVTAEVVATMRGISRESVYELVDGGADTFMWVFNVGTSRSRELRFWAREQREAVAVRNFSLAEVIGEILPRPEIAIEQCGAIPQWRVADLLRVPRRTVYDLRAELRGQARSGGIFIPRAALENFFRERWLFAGVLAGAK